MIVFKKYFMIFLGAIFLITGVVSAQQIITSQKPKKDPFLPLISPEGLLLETQDDPRFSDLKVEGIIFDKNALSYAVINSVVVKVGDKIGDYEVLKIEPQKVQLIKDANITEIKLKKED